MTTLTDILLATTNPNKQAALRRMLEGLPIRIHSPGELNLGIDVIEDGRTFAENALLKARSFRDAAGLPALADDSGLCVDALDGAPGIHSARFGGLDHSPTAQNLLLLEMLADVSSAARGAEFVSVIAFAAPDGGEWTAEGRVRGVITSRMRGAHGFGYDPVFLVPEIGKTFAELTGDEKDAISHRGLAMKIARSYIEKALSVLK